MILEDKDILERINSSNNLMNRLKLTTQRSEILPTQNRKNSIIDIPSLPSRSSVITSVIKGNFTNQPTDESQPSSESDQPDSPELTRTNTNPTIDELIDDLPTKIKIGTAHVCALDVLNSSLNNLKYLVDDIGSPKELANLAMVMHKIVHDNSRPKDSDSIGNRGSIVIWKPMMINSDTMNVVQARE
jgi:hypothetical protein